jgi:signal transduction histidine kinase
VSEQKGQENKLSEYAKREEILLEVSFLFSSALDFAKQLSDALCITGSYLDVSRIYIFEDFEEKKASRLTFEWLNPSHDFPAPINRFNYISYQHTPSWKEYLSLHGRMNSRDMQPFPSDMEDLLKSQQAESFLVIPLFIRGKISGFIGFDDYKKYNTWEDSDLVFLTTLSNIFSHAIERHRAIQALEKIVENQHHISQELIRQNNDLQQFTHIISHNLRAPIANLLGLVSLIRPDEPLHESNKVSMEHIKIVSNQLDLIARDLNEIVEIKEHIVPETRESLSLKEELKEVLKNLERQIYATQAHIAIDFTKVSHIFTIQKYLNSILLHLLSNAIKYKHPDRTPLIKLSDEIIDDFICLTVEDNGLGIDLKKNAAKIFGLHQRFHYHVGGRGIGLYLVKLQIEALAGRIEVESQPEKGSVFKVYLPK